MWTAGLNLLAAFNYLARALASRYSWHTPQGEQNICTHKSSNSEPSIKKLSLILPLLIAAPTQHNTIGQQQGTQQFSLVALLTALPCTTQKPQGRQTTARTMQQSCRQPQRGTVQEVRIWQLWVETRNGRGGEDGGRGRPATALKWEIQAEMCEN